MKMFFKIAFRNIIKNRTRSLILASAIMLVTIVLVVVTSITEGIQDTMMKSSTTLFSGHVNIAGFYKLSVSSAAPMITKTKELREIARTTIPEATYIVDRVNGYGKIISDASSLQLPMMGIDVLEERPILKTLVPLHGDIFELQKGKGIILFKSQATKLNVSIGDAVTLSIPTFRNTNNTLDVKVVAILKDMGYLSNFAAFIDKRDMREVYKMPDDSSGRVMIFLNKVNLVSQVENQLRETLQKNGFIMMDKDPRPFWMKFEKVAAEGWTGQKLDLTNWEDEVSVMKWIITLFNVLTIALTTVLLTIISLGLMNMLWITIKERTGEIGTMRAIGMQQRSVMFLFLIEPLMLSAFATLVGISFGALLANFLNLLHLPINNSALQAFLMSDTLTLKINGLTMVTIFIFITLFSTLGALIPAYRGGKMKPVTAMGVNN